LLLSVVAVEENVVCILHFNVMGVPGVELPLSSARHCWCVADKAIVIHIRHCAANKTIVTINCVVSIVRHAYAAFHNRIRISSSSAIRDGVVI
jgi:hypothetical protein